MTMVTATEHHQALTACATIRAAWPDLPTSTTVGTAEHDAAEALALLNELAFSHATNMSMGHARYLAAMDIIRRPGSLSPGHQAAPEYTASPEENGGVVCTTLTGRRYAVTKTAEGWQRGYIFGATVADAMRGAEA
jgi:hypothetical protein